VNHVEESLDFSIPRLGECTVPSPMRGVHFTADGGSVLLSSDLKRIQADLESGREPARLEAAGPREMIYFNPEGLRCGIVTCGGLCPGLNNVIRSIVLSLHHHYGVRTIYGFRYGYEGLVPDHGHEPLMLTPPAVANINEMGGTILGSSRGKQDVEVMVDRLERLHVGILFCIGGDGTQRGALAISQEARRRGLKLAVIGIPKTIDNDISFVQRTFGFETAVAEAKRATHAAHFEAVGARNGIGLVKLMGRDSGFIAAYAVLVDNQVNFCLIPEMPFSLDGLIAALTRRLDLRGHAVIVVAEGAGQELFPDNGERDASGNKKLGDIGILLRDHINAHFKGTGREITLKYIDPSYIIRSQPANANDSAFCLLLGHSAVHAGMAGRTGMMVGYWSHQFTHVPTPLATRERKKIDPQGWIWSSVLAATGQPAALR
jgi:6-phosphofructokinase 1